MTDITVKNDGLDLTASVYGPEGAPDILFLHGIAGSRDTWEEAARRYEDRFHVWTLDFRGHGHSDRAGSYFVEDYASDAAAMLDFIRRPTIVAGHSLGAVAAAYLGHEPHRFLKALFLEDPPYFMDDRDDFENSGPAKAFAAIHAFLEEAKLTGAAFDRYLEWTRTMPTALGGPRSDHTSPRHLLSAASGYMRQDPACWEAARSTAQFESFDPSKPLKVPTFLLRADPALGAAILAGHEKRFVAANPGARIVLVEGASHRIHATRASEPRFFEELDGFLQTHAG
ncbi:alpha/beta fold hydrolase [Hyphococcus luteus]|nr:alpha/beta hydrolase [Marinicaulis flavus]